MKNTLLVTILLVSFSVVNAQSFNCLSGSTVPVTVGSGPGLFAMGGFDCSGTSATGSVTLLEGAKVYVDGAFNSNNNVILQNDGANGSYGQLIVKDDTPSNVASSVSVERFVLNSNLVPISFPFRGYTTANLESDIQSNPGSSGFIFRSVSNSDCLYGGAPCGRRYNSSLFYQDNATTVGEHQTTENTAIIPERYYLLFERTGSVFKNLEHAFRGAPFNEVSNVVYNALDIDYANGINLHNERYTTYLTDDFVSDTANPAYGDNLLWLGNPYTSNIDLSTIGFDEGAAGGGTLPGQGTTGIEIENDGMALVDLQGASFFTSSSFTDRQGSTSTYIVATVDPTGRFVGGDVNALIVEPFVPFTLKFDPDFNSGTRTFTFSDALKTFRTSSADRRSETGNPLPNTRLAARTSADSYYQVALELSTEGTPVDAAFVVTSNQVDSGVTNTIEAPKNDIGESALLYTYHESVDGGINEADPLALRINTIGSDYTKAIPLAIDPKGSTDLALSLRFFSEDGSIVDAFSNSSVKYFFHDKETEDYIEITSDFNYPIDVTTFTGDRYELFLSEIIDEEEDPTDVTSNETQIGVKEDGDIGIVFSSEELGDTASVQVFNILGRLLYSADNVSTSDPKTVSIANVFDRTFIIVVTGENGTQISEKILR